MLKCGQKDNAKYTFGLRKEQMGETDIFNNIVRDGSDFVCSKCGKHFSEKVKFCSSCGSKI